MSFYSTNYKGIDTNGHGDQNFRNLFFVDDLKLHARTISQMRQILDQVAIERGEIIEQVEPIAMNEVTINPVKTNGCYKY